MNKIPGYKINKKVKVNNEPKKNQITILITEKNCNHLKKCLKDPAFIASISKLIFKDNPDKFSVRVVVTTLIKE